MIGKGRTLVGGGSPYSTGTPALLAAAALLPSPASFVLKQKMSHCHREAGPQLSLDEPLTRSGANVSQLRLVCLRVTAYSLSSPPSVHLGRTEGDVRP